jgi:hypothetical protein
MPSAKLNSFTAACCCLICCMSCVCPQCVIHKYQVPLVIFDGHRAMIDAIKEMERLDRAERKRYMLAKLQSLQVRVTMTGKYYFTWQIGTGSNRIVVCRRGFELAYHISSWYTDDLISRLKDGDMNVDACFSDRSAIEKKSGINDARVIAFCKHFDISLSRKQLRALKIPNSLQSLSTVAWMNYYFKLMADNVPNAAEELHLEPIKKKDIYEEYRFDCQCCHELVDPISESLFLDIWKSVFGYVKIRKFKQCCGKCNLCAYLSELRRKFTDARGREEVSRLFEVHRMTYMGERESYYARRLLGMIEPWNYLSTITDGMQQNRCMLPWYAHRKPPPTHLKQHLQGILMHGKNVRVYRSFSNVCVNANFCVHTWLLSLEELYKKGKLPPVLFHQIDGGSENANVLYLLICFMLVAKGLCRKVVLSRLLPGHTHEDIDALFALIWNMVRDEIILTPSEFKAAIEKAFQTLSDVQVIDIHACPNYTKYFEGFFDTELGRFAKEEWTQLKMTFERVGDDERDRYPFGVKTTYEAYDQAEVIEIVDDPDKESITGLIPQLTLCPVCPADDEPPVSVMKSIPPAARTIEVDPFIAGSRQYTVACADRMERSYADKRPEVAAEWKMWRDEVAPQSDIATDYIAEHPLHVPFLEQLFSGAVMSDYEVESRDRAPRRVINGKNLPDMRVVTATSSVKHSGDKSNRMPRTVVETVDGVNVSADNISARAHIVVNPRKPRAKKAKKAATPAKKAAVNTTTMKKKKKQKKKSSEDKESEEGSDDDDAGTTTTATSKPTTKKIAKKNTKKVKKREIVDSSEEESDEEESDSDDAAIAGFDGPDHHDVVIRPINVVQKTFKVEDKVMNKKGLRGRVVKCHDNGTYHVLYNDKREDKDQKGQELDLIPPGNIYLFIKFYIIIILIFYIILFSPPPSQSQKICLNVGYGPSCPLDRCRSYRFVSCSPW